MASAQPLVDHDRIRQWAEARGAQPACVRGTGGRGDTGMIRLDFPGFSGGKSLQKISWKEWFRQFDENNLALLVQERTSRGQRSNFNKLVSRRAAAGASGKTDGRGAGRQKRAAAPRTRTASAARKGSASATTARGTTSARRRASGRAQAEGASAKRRTAATTKERAGTRRPASRAGLQRGRTQRATPQRGSRKRAGGTRPLTNHEDIRAWAEARNARPACVKGTGGRNDTGMIRLDFPGFSGRESLQEISWREWFRQFDQNNLALLVQETTARGQRSNFNKVVSRETAGRSAQSAARSSSRATSRRQSLSSRSRSPSR